MNPGSTHARQAGQALVEALVALSMLLLIWAAIAWLGRYQDIALQASHASRYAAFAIARGETPSQNAIRQDYFLGPTHRWADRRGALLLAEDQITLDADRGPALHDMAQPAQAAEYAQTLREQWGVADSGIVDARISVAFTSRQLHGGPEPKTFMSGIRDFDKAYPGLARHTSILVDAGHALDDSDAQQRVAGSDPAWADAARTSYGLAQQIKTVMNPVDAGWHRPGPTHDWLEAWVGAVPDQHLHYGEQP